MRSTSCYTTGVAREINQRELRNYSGKIMRALDEGAEFTITRNGSPVGELIPLRRRRYIKAEAAIAVFQSAPPVDYDTLRSDLGVISSQDIAPCA